MTYLGTACTPAFVASMTTSGDYITIEGSGSSCGDTTGSRYCGGYFSSVNENAADTPICGKVFFLSFCSRNMYQRFQIIWIFFFTDCSSPFFVGVRFDTYADTKSDGSVVASNRGTTFF